MTVRVARLEDKENLLMIMEAFAQDSPYRDDYSVERLHDSVTEFLEVNENNAVAFVTVDGEDRPVGFLFGSVTDSPFTKQLTAIEWAWWVAPAYRQLNRGVDLLDAFERWAPKVGASKIMVSSLSTSPRAVDRLYEAKGYSPVEKYFVKGIK